MKNTLRHSAWGLTDKITTYMVDFQGDKQCYSSSMGGGLTGQHTMGHKDL